MPGCVEHGCAGLQQCSFLVSEIKFAGRGESVVDLRFGLVQSSERDERLRAGLCGLRCQPAAGAACLGYRPIDQLERGRCLPEPDFGS